MPPTKAQKNAPAINDLKDILLELEKLEVRLTSRYNADSTNRATNLLRYARSEITDRMVELGVVIKMEDGKDE